MNETITNTQGGWQANVLEMKVAKAASAALKAGKDPMTAAQERLKEMGLPPDDEEESDVDTRLDKRRYLLAVCRLGSGQFEHLNDADLMDVAALVKLPFHSPQEWEDIRERA